MENIQKEEKKHQKIQQQMEEESQQKHRLRGHRGPGPGGEQLEMDEE